MCLYSSISTRFVTIFSSILLQFVDLRSFSHPTMLPVHKGHVEDVEFGGEFKPGLNWKQLVKKYLRFVFIRRKLTFKSLRVSYCQKVL